MCVWVYASLRIKKVTQEKKSVHLCGPLHCPALAYTHRKSLHSLTHTQQTFSHMEEGMAVAVADAHMEELVERSGFMAAEAEGAGLREPYHGDALLAPEADFIVGQSVSFFQ